MWIFMILWVLSPIILIPSVIILYVMYSNLKKELRDDRTDHDQQKEDQGLKQSTQSAKVIEDKVLPVTLEKKKNENAVPYGNAVSTTLIIGVLFILIAGLIFATTTWRLMPDLLKVILLFSVTGVFYAASYLAENWLKLRRTGMAFYLLTCLFFPLVLLAIGYFALLGSWFSIYGEGKYFLYFIMEAGFMCLTIIGFRRYRVAAFKYISRLASFWAVGTLALAVSGNWDIGVLAVWLYGLWFAFWLIYCKQVQLMKYVHPFILLGCMFQMHDHVLQLDHSISGIVWSFCMLVAFWAYYHSGRLKKHSLRTPCSDYLYLSTVFLSLLGLIWRENYGWGIMFLLCLIGCLGCLAIKSGKGLYSQISSWLTMGCVLYLYVPIYILLLDNHIDGIFASRFLSYFMLTVFIGVMCSINRKLRAVLNVFLLPANVIWGISGFVSFMYGFLIVSDIHTQYIWILVFLWFLQRRRRVYVSLFTVCFLFLPSLTLWEAVPDLPVLIYWYLLACIALGYYIMAWCLGGIGAWEKCLLRRAGISGLYASLFISAILFLTDSSMESGYGICLLVFAAVCGWIGFKEGNTIPTGAIYIAINPLIYQILIRWVDLGDAGYLWVSAVVSVGMMVIGRLLYKKIWEIGDIDGKKCYYLDWLSLLAVLGPSVMVVAQSAYWRFWGFMLAAGWLLNGYHRIKSNHETVTDAWVLSGASCMIFLAWRFEPYLMIPQLLETEFYLAGLLMAGLAAGWIWAGKSLVYGVFRYCIGIYAVLRLGFDALYYTRLADVLILGSAMVLLLLLSYFWRRIRWFVLSSVTLVFLALYLSRSFWLSIAWWIYLLAAGLILIAVAAYYEYTRREGNHIKTHIAKILDDWAW